MQSLILKANAKKMKRKQIQNNYESDGSNEELTSDDEIEVSKGMLGEIFNNRYFCIKYL